MKAAACFAGSTPTFVNRGCGYCAANVRRKMSTNTTSQNQRVVLCCSTLDNNNININSTITRRDAMQTLFASLAVVTAHAIGAPSTAVAAGEKNAKLKFETLDSGVAIAMIKKGSGVSPRDGDLVIVDYVGYLSNGTIFDNTKTPGRKPLAFQLGQRKVIPGIEDALRVMKVGGESTIVVPPKLAYGERGVCFAEQGCLIPPNETLEYDLTLVRVAVSPI
eukprot:CAMPEP_0185850432 /NCGR_PEP_ID=MMETSP1354-20130828/4570_1 /TAXON_ID=708628 /ORGANISM="Erythrolobus madagascarensis, Strain CCMP3276" /LENGTH=219 /DNA_ID=CAMNT_0028551109 /DNA_START=23 /DNA_END=682 /DNA_ORIENTATION=-